MTATPSTAARPHLKLRADGRIEPMLLSPERAAGLAAYREARAARAAAAAQGGGQIAPAVLPEQPRPGRPASVQPHQVVQLVNLRQAGASVRAAETPAIDSRRPRQKSAPPRWRGQRQPAAPDPTGPAAR